MTRALLYARQSVEKDGGDHSLSLDSQVSTLEARCQREGWHIVGIIREAGLKGWMDADERPGLADAIARAEAGDYDTFLVWDLSRLARSVRLQEHWVWQFSRFGVDVVSHSEPHAANALIRQITGAVNEHRTEEIKKHIRRGLRERGHRKLHHGNVPWGYTRPNATSPLRVDRKAAEEVSRIFAMRLAGTGPAEIARDLTRRAVPTPTGLGAWRVGSISRVLRCATYRGAIRAGDVWIEGAHKPIVTPDDWWRAQEGHQRRAPRQKLIRSWLEGRIEHGCGRPMYLIQSHAGRQPYFRCRVGAAGILSVMQEACPIQPRRIVVSLIEEMAWAALRESLERISRVSPRRVLAETKQRQRQDAPAADAARREAQERKKRAAARRSKAEDLYLSGSRDRAWFDVEDARAAVELADAEGDLMRLPTPPDDAAIMAHWETLRTLHDVVATIHPEDRGAVLHALGTAVVADGGITIRVRPEFAGFWDSAHQKVR